ncbi:MAG: hypothetical protein WCT28_01130 [Patescibacteria group bacterium]|jgi:hypothetical protein
MNSQEERAELLRTIEFAGDQRLQLMVRHGFKNEFLAALREMMEEHTFYFQDHTRIDEPVIIGCRVDRETPRDRSGEKPELSIIDKIAVCIGQRKGTLTLRGLMEFFGWNEQQLTEQFLRNVFESTLKLNPRHDLWHDPSYRIMCSWEFYATINAARHFLPEGDDLRRRVEIWFTRAFFLAEYGPFRESASARAVERFLGKELPELQDLERTARRMPDEGSFYTRATDVIAEHLLALGLDAEELAEDFTVLIERNVHMQPIWTGAIAVSKTVQGLDPVRKQRVKAAMLNTLPHILDHYMFEDGISHDSIECWMRACGSNLAQHKPCAKAFAKALVDRMVDGRIIAAHEIVTVFGHRFGAYLKDRGGSRGLGTERWAEADLTPLVARAFDQAYAAEKFGNAALLVLVYGADACFDRELLRPKAKKEAKGGKYKEILDELCVERQTQIREIFGITQAAGQTAELQTRLRFVRTF